ncbi:hypothetical protein K450DRAFT_242106 [Umbelopsis ramanniana AG]|uniref:ADP-ribosylglycohydrolase n=1 Tax=Umbelopsis ramanniana AG TaxID=1314678 RepID=A0AAD5E8T5_UMBRA|nr:uncharacterized protein K450DRAFT_242106 [Umbelopsis ramanniana AG]KAI8579426.1 hypothetical protein K450DRAFT_242106 [Umbelopsis ramanniana AG]
MLFENTDLSCHHTAKTHATQSDFPESNRTLRESQARIPSGCSKLSRLDIVDKVKGLIFGAVLGDCLGLATEGMTREQVEAVYGEGPIRFGLEDEDVTGVVGVPFIRDAYRSMFDDNDFGDDTDQQLLLVQSLIHTGGVFNNKDFAKRLKDWSQHGLVALSKPPLGTGRATQYTINHPAFEHDPHRAAADVWRSKHVLRSANGAITRAPLLGVVKFWDGTTVIENSADCCRVTHSDPRSIASCAIVSTLVARMLRSQDTEYNDYPPSPTSSLSNPHYQDQMLRSPSNTPPLSNQDLVQNTANKKYFIDTLSTDPCLLSLVDSAIEANQRCLTAPNTDPLFYSPETDQQLTQSYYSQLLAHCYPPVNLESLALDHTDDNQDVFKTLGAAIYGFTRQLPKGEQTSSFKRILMDVVLQGGEADTNASVTGALLGLRMGYSMLPSEWVVGLKHWEWLEDCVEEFVALL